MSKDGLKCARSVYLSRLKRVFLLFKDFFIYFCQAISRVIDSDEEVGKLRTLIDGGVEKAAKQLQEYTKRWDE